MENQSVIKVKNLQKKFKGFELDIPELQIPKGFATALIGENGAGKTTLLNILAGIRLDYKGEITYFNKWKSQDEGTVREYIGYTGPGNYFLPQWTIRQVSEVSEILFEHFHKERFAEKCRELGITEDITLKKGKKVSALSDGTRMKLMLAGVLARDTNLLILDEPASPLDPLMRDKLCDLLHEYLDQGDGERTVFFSTHNITDMENVTDYAIIMEHGTVVEKGFVEDLKEKYVLVKGESKDVELAEDIMYSFSKSQYGFEGICLAKDLTKLAGMDISMERPTLFQISVAVMKKNTKMQIA